MREVFVLESLDALDMVVVDVGSIFLCCKTKENVHILAQWDFGGHKGSRILIDKWFCGLVSSSARFYEKLTSSKKIYFKPSIVDHDL